MAIKTYLVRGRWASIPGARTRTERIVATATAAGAAEALGVSTYTISRYAMPGGPDDRATALAQPGVVLHRPHTSNNSAPWHPADQPYPLDDIPENVRRTTAPLGQDPRVQEALAIEDTARRIARGEADDIAAALDQITAAAARLRDLI